MGAWGCGVYGCPPTEVAELFKEALAQFGSGRHFYFAISKKRANLEAFEKVFHTKAEFYAPSYRRKEAAKTLMIIYTFHGDASLETSLLRQVPKPLVDGVIRTILEPDPLDE